LIAMSQNYQTNNRGALMIKEPSFLDESTEKYRRSTRDGVDNGIPVTSPENEVKTEIFASLLGVVTTIGIVAIVAFTLWVARNVFN